MDYSRIYNELISSRMLIKNNRVADRKNGVYFERHHIIMKSKGGDNSYENIAFLTAREHFIAHWLLWKIYRDRSSALAFHKMISKNNLRQSDNRYYSSRGYEEARLAFRETNKGNNYGKRENHKKPHRMTRQDQRDLHSITMKGTWAGDKNPFYGKKHTQETREKMSKKAKERFKNGNKWSGKIVLNIETGIYYDSARDASECLGVPHSTLKSRLNGTHKNKTSYIYV